MSAHTEGRLRVRETGEGSPGLFFEGDDAAVAVMFSDAHMNIARRICATWNACFELSTETLETVPDMVKAGIRTISAVEAERDELVEALRKMVDAVNKHDLLALDRACDEADTLLAKHTVAA
jgi:hypothetical protein